MKLREIESLLVDGSTAGTIEHPEATINGITYNSREVKEGYIFVAITGHQQDGHDFINEAVEKGACAIIGEEKKSDLPVPYFQVTNSRKTLSLLSDHFYDFPTAGRIVIGVTGTNGKTTTGSLIRSALESSGVSCAFFGSTYNIINGIRHKTRNTTPNLLEINRLLSGSNDEAVVIEVSSHALTQHRVEGLTFDYALFTNLSHDHLDYHGSMEEYFQAKKKLFTMLKKGGTAVINKDDYWGELLAEQLKREGASVLTIGEQEGSDIEVGRYSSETNHLVLKEGTRTFSFTPSLYGYHNMYNIAMAYAVAADTGTDGERVRRALERFEGVEGRFTVIHLDRGVTVAIDYAHTPDALFHCLNTAREQCKGTLIHLFGFRGDRDATKQKDMVSFSSEMSDRYILTFDDLNSMSSEKMEERLFLLQNEHGRENGEVISDRTLAIEEAIRRTGEGDWILITGKGHETYQQSYHHPVKNDEEAVLFLDKQSQDGPYV